MGLAYANFSDTWIFLKSLDKELHNVGARRDMTEIPFEIPCRLRHFKIEQTNPPSCCLCTYTMQVLRVLHLHSSLYGRCNIILTSCKKRASNLGHATPHTFLIKSYFKQVFSAAVWQSAKNGLSPANQGFLLLFSTFRFKKYSEKPLTGFD